MTGGAKVINLSLGTTTASLNDRFAYQRMYGEGVLIVASAGNNESSDYLFPASFDQVISVGAVDANNNHAVFSQYNDQVELVAPGVGVRSTIPNNRYETHGHVFYASLHLLSSSSYTVLIVGGNTDRGQGHRWRHLM